MILDGRKGIWQIFCVVGLFALVLGCQGDDDASSSSNSAISSRSDRFLSVAHAGTHVVVVGARGAVISSSDGGQNWSRQNLRVAETVITPSLISVTSCPDGSFAALDAERHIWVSKDGLGGWTSRILPTTENPMAITCDETGAYWVVGSFSTLWTSADQGASWREQSFNDDLIFTTIQFPAPGEGIITGEFGAFLVSHDGGKTWLRDHDIPNEFYPEAAFFQRDARVGWVSGLNGAILHTVDGGASWIREETGVAAPLYGFAAGQDALYALGDQGTVLRRSGGHWVLAARRSTYDYLSAGFVLDGGSLFVAGGSGAFGLAALEPKVVDMEDKGAGVQAKEY